MNNSHHPAASDFSNVIHLTPRGLAGSAGNDDELAAVRQFIQMMATEDEIALLTPLRSKKRFRIAGIYSQGKFHAENPVAFRAFIAAYDALHEKYKTAGVSLPDWDSVEASYYDRLHPS